MSSLGKWVAGIVSGVLVAVIAALLVPAISGSPDNTGQRTTAVRPQLPDPGGGPAEIFLNRDSGPAGTKVLVSGEGFQAGEKVALRFHTDEVARFTVDRQGSFTSVSARVPKGWQFRGPFTFVATGSSSLRSADRSFRVT